MLVVAATAFEALAVATVLPATSAELGGIAWYGWTFSAFMLANLVGITVGGTETDRRGPTLPFLLGVALFMGGLVVSGLAPSMPVIVVGRVSQGLGAGLLSAVAYASIARAYSVELQPRMLATLSSAWVVPGLVGPGLSSLIAAHASWRWVFLGLAPLPALGALLVVPALKQIHGHAQPAAGSRNWLSLQLALGSGAALAALSQHGWWIALGLPGAVVAVRALDRLLPHGSLLARKGLPASVATMGLITFAFFGVEAFLPLALNTIRGEPITTAGVSLTAAAVFWTVGAWLPVRLTRVGRRVIVASGLGVLALGFTGVLALLSPAVPAWTAVASWGISGLGMGLAFTTTSAAILEAAPPGQEGAVSSSLQLAQVLGAALSTGAGGAIVVAPFAGDPPRTGIAVVDLLMIATTVLGIRTAWQMNECAAHPR